MSLCNSDIKLETDFSKYPFLRNGGEMGKLIHDFDWQATVLGPVDSWPVSLRNTVSMIVASRFPMFLWWGNDLIQFYNDAYRPSLGNTGKHPEALGGKGHDTWPEIWDKIYPLIQQVLNGGESIYLEDQLIPIYRNGKLEDIYWTFSYSAVLNDDGTIGGVLVTCSETTDKIGKLEQITKIKDQLEYAIGVNEVATWELDPVTGLIKGNSVLKNWFGLEPTDDVPLFAATDVISDTDRERVVTTIQHALTYESGGSYDTQYTIINPHTLKPRIVRARGQVWFKDKQPYRFNGTLVDITDAARAQQKIDEANQLTDLAVNSAGVGLFKVDLITGEMNYNSTFATILTGNPDKAGFNRKSFLKHIHKDDLAARAAALAEGNETNEFYYAIRTIWDDGSVHKITVNGANTFDDNGKPILFSGIVRDVTAQENSRIALEASESSRRDIDTKFYNVTSGAPTGLWLNDENGVITYVNKTLEDWTDKSEEYFIGKNWTDIIAGPDRVQAKRAFQKAIDKELPYDAISRVEKYDGHLIWCRTSAEPIFDDKGNFKGHAGYCMDMDELIKSRRALSESEMRFRSMIEQAPVGTCLYTGPDMKIEVANEIILKYWGKDKSVIGMPLAQAVPELINQPFMTILDDVYKSGKLYTESSAPATVMVNGVEKLCYYDYTFKPLFDASGKVYGIMNMAFDVTDQVMARQKIETSEARFRALIEQAPVATCLFTGPEMKIEVANEIMLGYWGKGNSVMGKPLADALPELRSQPFLKILDKIYKTGIAHTETSAPARLVVNGIESTYYFDYTYKPVFDSNGNVYGVMDMAVDVTEQVMARQKIEASEAKFRSLIEQAPVATCLFTGPEMKIEVANKIILDYWGRDKSVIGLPLAEALPELQGQPFLELLRNVYTTGIAYSDSAAPAKLVVDGKEQTFYFNYTYKPVFDSNGNVYGVMDMGIEVTDQVMARRKVEASEAKFRALIEKAPIATSLYTGPDHVIEFANEIMLGYWGRDMSVIGLPVSKALPELEGQPFLELLANIYKTGEMHQEYEAPATLEHNGRLVTYYFDYTYKPLFDDRGEVYSILNMAQDVTERVKARVKIENARKALHGAIELAELATWSLDIKTNVFTYSPRFMEWLGITQKSLNLNDFDLLTDDDITVSQKIREAVKAGSSGIYDDEYTIINKISGQKRIIHSQAQITYNENGNPLMLSGTAQDITKERKLQQQLEFEVKQRTEQLQDANAELANANNALQQNNQELAQFAYIASHDLQEPVRKISIFTKMLKQTVSSENESQISFINKIENASDRMGNLIRDVLRFSVLSKDNEVFEPVDLNIVIRDILNDFELTIDENNAVITYDNLPVINAIPLQMSQLFGNLISNSLKYMKPGVSPVISIQSSVADKNDLAAVNGTEPGIKYYKIELKDNGIGFEQEYAEKIFTIFQRLHDKSSYSGTGIGLAMCKKIVLNHDGYISASGVKGEGAVFTILFPVEHHV